MRRAFGQTLLVVALAAGALASSATALAQEGENVADAHLEGCEGVAMSLRNDGTVRDRAAGSSDRKSSSGEPFHVGPNDTVRWQGTMPAAGRFDWSIKVTGVTVDKGSEEGGRRTEWSGEKDVDDLLPFKLTGVYHLEWDLDGETHACHGDLWIKLDGNPIWTTPWVIGAALILIAGAGLWIARPSRKPAVAASAPATEADAEPDSEATP